MSPFFLSQILTGLTLCSDITSFQLKKRRNILLCLIFSSSTLALHFALLGHWTAASLALFGAIRFAVGFYTANIRLAWLFVAMIAVITIFTWEGPLSLLASGGSAICNLGTFQREDKRLRLFMFPGTICWLSHNILAGSPGAVVVEIVFFCSNLIGYYRFYLAPKRSQS
ncbi:YgjV family protein [Desulforhopalus vacuolatus]|uniref:YgjV family protein n=1 Tax=Desulforhopalus vacuolatus TaxID=40414 RepID=UPI001962D8BB|nr:YgjV family protein [Desulforhopalus vacuolatus]MBM9519275.1 YgjV family protein [Desulforhopalus vacuolatus]